MTTYIAGGMTGLPQNNYPAFFSAEEMLVNRGEEVENPAINTAIGEGDTLWIRYMYMGLKQLLNCDKIYLLKGWEYSEGARLEFQIACALKMKVEFQ